MMAKYIKFTIGGYFDGYKTVEIFISGNSKVVYQILRNGLLDVEIKKSSSAKMSSLWLKELDELEIFSWEKNYHTDILDGTQWELIFKDGEKIYHGQGSNAYPENWERFLDWLDALIPQLEFVYRKRLEKITMTYFDEQLMLDRNEKTLTLDKKKSTHIYDLGEDVKEIFETCQNFFDYLEIYDEDNNSDSQANVELIRHDGSTDKIELPFNENSVPGLNDFIAEIRTYAADLTAEIFSPSTVRVVPQREKLILCKVQFPSSYKHYTYSTDDETLAVGDVVDVPVGRNNAISQAKIVEIGYFDEYEAPFPIDRIKKIIGKHVAADWENY